MRVFFAPSLSVPIIRFMVEVTPADSEGEEYAPSKGLKNAFVTTS